MTGTLAASLAAASAHGGPDGGAPIRFDFSTNANPYGPPDALWQAVVQADRQRYPDPAYRGLRERLAAGHAVAPARIEPASGGAEAIRRLTLAAQLSGLAEAWVPQPGFGDYAASAAALGMAVHGYAAAHALRPERPALVWACDPCNPTGASLGAVEWQAVAAAVERSGSLLAVDAAYDALRLDGGSQLPAGLADRAWRLQCPNKALGLTGVRAAYLIAPAHGAHPDLAGAVARLAPSWVLSAEGQALLLHWHDAATRAHLEHSRAQLRGDRQALRDAMRRLGWPSCGGSATPFWLAQAPAGVDLAALHARLRAQGIKLRDATSFGLPGWVRVAAQPAPAVAALLAVLETQGGMR
ncbi:MAG: aminotransferase class I/II-fold pyridoxal phosphate-dependent enzyme [Pelomonas sp.]|nr:aminotransferase class I/II-fold pyridoxal phosphate-dependent enzyme [Roseateles sp.]